jgi:hypothetical protein
MVCWARVMVSVVSRFEMGARCDGRLLFVRVSQLGELQFESCSFSVDAIEWQSASGQDVRSSLVLVDGGMLVCGGCRGSRTGHFLDAAKIAGCSAARFGLREIQGLGKRVRVICGLRARRRLDS